MQRILIIGCSGAGKSTLARELSAILQNFKREVHPKNLNLLSRCSDDTKIITLRKPREVASFLNSLS
jgi:ABC-type phosphate/phosphonate transport system ATPase subunit